MKNVIVVIVAILLIAGGAFWYANSGGSSNSSSGTFVAQDSAPAKVSESVSGKIHTIDVKASRFSYDPGTITVKKGEVVRLNINNVDTTHGIVIPDLGVSGIDSVEFTADKAGTYEFKCPTVCGSGHRNMKGTLVVEE